VPPWIFKYSVVYPNHVTVQVGEGEYKCANVQGIKFYMGDGLTCFATGSWTNLRDRISQPLTIVQNALETVSNWAMTGLVDEDTVPAQVGWTDPTPGPTFTLAAAPGQLVPVYWQPRYQDIQTALEPIVGKTGAAYRDSGSAEIALLVTSPLQPNQTIYFTNEQFNDVSRGFGPRNPVSGSFLNPQPAFAWVTGARVIPAGTVVFIRNIGADADPITIQDAQNSAADVGSIPGGGIAIAGQAVPSLMVLGAWLQHNPSEAAATTLADKFACAALSDQYAGDYPPLSPTLTINQFAHQWTGQVIYGMGMDGIGEVFDASGMPGSVQSAAINSAEFRALPFNTAILPASLPKFLGMECWSF
jgi:hypothetical protein